MIPNPNRAVHRHIADLPLGSPIPTSSAPLLAFRDGVWNHGEGFGSNPTLDGGWHGPTDGTNVTLADVHINANDIWVPFTWAFPNSVNTWYRTYSMQRMEGYLRPAAATPLPTTHPLYGPVGGPYVDQGAFELFRPNVAWSSQKVLLIIHCKETAGFPQNRLGQSLEWRQMYRGFYSADGLVRREAANAEGAGWSFLATDNLDGDEVERPILNTIANWSGAEANQYYPIEAYPVISVMKRSTTLNEQRYMQLVQAVKELMTDSSLRNPLHDAQGNPMPQVPQWIENNVVVCFTGGSNGGMQCSLATLRYPHLVHGCFAEAINPSYQRLYAEFDLERAMAQLTSGAMGPFECTEDDFMTWNQYVWSQGLEMHDMSYTRLFHRILPPRAYRPTCFGNGDEDVTSTGVNWMRLMDGTIWRASGVVPAPLPFAASGAHTFAWMAGENARHQANTGPLTNPYTTLPMPYSFDVRLDLWQRAIQVRGDQIAIGATIPIPALSHIQRSSVPQADLRWLDDPQEWWLGRQPPAIPTPSGSDPLQPDTVFNSNVNPGATGNAPAGREAMFISNNLVYVGSADGFVSSFYVDNSDPKKPLRRYAISPQLGHECFTIGKVSTTGGSWYLIAGTRRHLHRLDPWSLQPLQPTPSIKLPYEVAQPHHITCDDVLPGHSGPEIIFASVHGGLCFYDPTSLAPIYEWPEPGIIDFFVHQGAVTLLSSRGVVATVQFVGTTNAPTLTAVSKPIQQQLLEYGAIPDPPCMGVPTDLELMRVNWTGFGLGLNLATISSWSGDTDGSSVRGHWLPTLAAQPYLPGRPSNVLDIATCTESNPGSIVGDHALVLYLGSQLELYDQYGGIVGQKTLTDTQQGTGMYRFGAGAHRMAVGELVQNSDPYSQEVVIATNTGLMWMHVQEIVGGTNMTLLPATGTAQGAFQSGFWLDRMNATTAAANYRVQPRTNQSMQATWAMARRPVGALGTPLDNYLHVLDQHGCYWQIDHTGVVKLREVSGLTVGSRGWDFVGAVGVPPIGTDLMPLSRQVGPLGTNVGIQTWPHCPIDTWNVAFEYVPQPFYLRNNWLARPLFRWLLDGFVVHDLGGATVSSSTGYEVWDWTAAPQGKVGTSPNEVEMGHCGNLVSGLRMDAIGIIDGLWASTLTAQDLCPHLKLRNFTGTQATLTAQSLQAVKLLSGDTAVVLGCPGGRVRVVRSGPWRVTDGTPHAFHPSQPLTSTDDLGLGVSALAVRHDVNGTQESLRIWFGTINHHDERPVAYASSTGVLADSEVGAGALHFVTWTPGSGFSTVSTLARMHPSAAHPDGASAVVGMLLTDLFPEPSGQPVRDELVVGTLSGDLLFYDVNPTTAAITEVWRTRVPGAIGCFNAIRAENLDNDPTRNELYVAGSFGLWKFH